MIRNLLACALVAALPGVAGATDWKPQGELGLVITSGNSDTTTLNAKFQAKGEDEHWIHDYYALALRAKSDDVDTAKRFELGGKSGYKINDKSYFFGALRYENDDFSPYEDQTSFSVGYGVWAIKSDLTTLLFEIGPGVRRADPVGPEDSETDFIGRGLADFHHKFNASTEFYNTLLVEAASDNTFAQNDIGVQVKMSESLALKAGLQARHNTDVPLDVDKTDTLTTINVVWTPN